MFGYHGLAKFIHKINHHIPPVALKHNIIGVEYIVTLWKNEVNTSSSGGNEMQIA